MTSKGSSLRQESWDEHLEKLIDHFKPFLLATMRVSHLLCLLPIQEVKDVAPVIHETEGRGSHQEASKVLLDAIKRSDHPGKWQMLVDALKEVEDTVILQTLLDEKDHSDPWLDDQKNLQLIQLFAYSIEEHLRLDSLLPKMLEKRLILPADLQKLRSMIRNGQGRGANAVLLLFMHRHSRDWFQIFMSILCDDEHHIELARKIDPEYVDKKQSKNQTDKGGEAFSSSVHSTGKQHPSARQQLGSRAKEEQHKEKTAGTPSLGGNLGSKAQSVRKDIGAKFLPSASYSPSMEGGSQASLATGQGEATCKCRCCAQMLMKVSSLEADLAEIKTLLKSKN